MSTSEDLLDKFANAASVSSPTPLSADREEELIRHAVLIARANKNRTEQLRTWIPLAIAATALLALAGMLFKKEVAHTPEIAAPSTLPQKITEPATSSEGRNEVTSALGDRWVTTSGTKLVVHSFDPRNRVLELQQGNALFDVARLGASSSFVVKTAHATVRVVGTVFAVSVDASSTHVRVYEGKVIVSDAAGQHELSVGEALATDSATDNWRSPLDDVGTDAARGRANTEVASTNEREELPAPNRAEANASRPTTLRDARELVAAGHFAEALGASSTMLRGEEKGEWWMVRADALRGLRRLEEAAAAYTNASRTLSPSRAALAGYLAARVYHEDLGQSAPALAVLDTSEAAQSGSPVEERALGLRAAVLAASGQTAEARRVARSYLLRFPNGSARPMMGRLAGAPE